MTALVPAQGERVAAASSGHSGAPLLAIEGLRIAFDGSEVVHGVSLSIAPGERLALVGESGSGKSVTALAILRLLESAQMTGSARWQGRELLSLDEREMRAIRGDEIAIVFQEPMTALNPLLSIGQQIAEVLEFKKGLKPTEAWQRVYLLLQDVGIEAPERRARSYPHQLSGGQRHGVTHAQTAGLQHIGAVVRTRCQASAVGPAGQQLAGVGMHWPG
ncbi:MAG: ATP-binding cassette domain-containing protein, partial [Limnohabitans sp.]